MNKEKIKIILAKIKAERKKKKDSKEASVKIGKILVDIRDHLKKLNI